MKCCTGMYYLTALTESTHSEPEHLYTCVLLCTMNISYLNGNLHYIQWAYSKDIPYVHVVDML